MVSLHHVFNSRRLGTIGRRTLRVLKIAMQISTVVIIGLFMLACSISACMPRTTRPMLGWSWYPYHRSWYRRHW